MDLWSGLTRIRPTCGGCAARSVAAQYRRDTARAAARKADHALQLTAFHERVHPETAAMTLRKRAA